MFELTQARSNMYHHRYGILGPHHPNFAEDRPICQLSHVVREHHGLHPNNRTLFLQLHYQCLKIQKLVSKHRQELVTMQPAKFIRYRNFHQMINAFSLIEKHANG